MKTTGWIVIAVVVVALVVGGYFLFGFSYKSSYGQTAPATNTQNQQTQTPPAQTTPPSSAALDSYNPRITIAEYSFTPDSVTIKTGHTVTWINQGSFPHTVTSDSGVELTSSSIQPSGGIYEHIFLKAGTYTYHCSIHPSMMKGTVTVIE